MVQDGRYYLDPDSEIRFAVVLENLIHKGEMPVTVGVFVDPGEFPGEEDPAARRNRNLEFDTYSDAYSRLLLEEILPPILQDYRIADDPDLWAVAGGSSGGDCSFPIAWMRPDKFRKVLMLESSWPQVRGADDEWLIMETPPKRDPSVHASVHARHSAGGGRTTIGGTTVSEAASERCACTALPSERSSRARVAAGDSDGSTMPASGTHGHLVPARSTATAGCCSCRRRSTR